MLLNFDFLISCGEYEDKKAEDLNFQPLKQFIDAPYQPEELIQINESKRNKFGRIFLNLDLESYEEPFVIYQLFLDLCEKIFSKISIKYIIPTNSGLHVKFDTQQRLTFLKDSECVLCFQDSSHDNIFFPSYFQVDQNPIEKQQFLTEQKMFEYFMKNFLDGKTFDEVALGIYENKNFNDICLMADQEQKLRRGFVFITDLEQKMKKKEKKIKAQKKIKKKIKKKINRQTQTFEQIIIMIYLKILQFQNQLFSIFIFFIFST